jgi:hypothetical protein
MPVSIHVCSIRFVLLSVLRSLFVEEIKKEKPRIESKAIEEAFSEALTDSSLSFGDQKQRTFCMMSIVQGLFEEVAEELDLRDLDVDRFVKTLKLPEGILIEVD